MSKSIYSLVLSDDVVRAIDELAYSNNTSRSNQINQILAQYLSVSTPERRHRDIFSEVVRMFDEQTRLQTQITDAMMSVRTAIRFKYNPTIRYYVELSQGIEGELGELRVVSRTQSTELLPLLNGFYRLMMLLEQRAFGPQNLKCSIEDGKLSKVLQLRSGQELNNIQAAEAIAGYIKMFDKALKSYFSYGANAEQAREAAMEVYKNYLKTAEVIL
jgi:hypothetical protein